MSKDLLTVTDKVQHLLYKYPILRDSDKKLWLSYLVNYCKLKRAMEANPRDSYQTLKSVVFNKSTPTMETITRARRKLQERFPDLRGDGYKTRQEEAEKVKEWAKT